MIRTQTSTHNFLLHNFCFRKGRKTFLKLWCSLKNSWRINISRLPWKPNFTGAKTNMTWPTSRWTKLVTVYLGAFFACDRRNVLRASCKPNIGRSLRYLSETNIVSSFIFGRKYWFSRSNGKYFPTFIHLEPVFVAPNFILVSRCR